MAGEELPAEKLIVDKPDEALEVLLHGWGKTFDPSLGRLIEALGASLATPLEGLPLKKGERAAALATLAKKAPDAERSAVLAAFEDFAREAAGRLVWPSIEAWAKTKPDPRVARMALRVLTVIQHGLTAKVWRRLVNCIEQHGDLGVVEDARAYEATLQKRGGGWGFSPERFSNVLKKLTKARKCTQPADPAAVARMLALVGGRTAPAPPPKLGDATAMIEAIVARPDDDGPRLVYADWLMEQRHPAGEFIALQTARTKARGRVSAAARAREEELLATQRKVLLGPFDGVVAKSDLRFERGFVVAARALENVPAHPLTRLLRQVEFEDGFANGARFDSLVEARGPEPRRNALPPLAPKLARWDVVGDEFPSLAKAIAKLQLEALTIRSLKNVRLDTLLGELFRSPATRGLKSVELFLDRTCTPIVALEAAPATLTSLIVRAGGQVDVTFTRTETGWSVLIDASYFANPDWVAQVMPELLAPFAKVPLQVATIELPVPASQRERFEGAIAIVRGRSLRVQWKKAW